MFEAFSRIRNCSFFCFFGFVLSIGFLQAQEKKATPGIEKIYLHTDKSIYFIGEDLWYKAYDVRAYNNLLYDNSNILYVELISPDAEIIARNKTNIEIGLGHGDFQLTDSLGVKPGVYQLRAYTNWNRNFGEDFVFKKNIEIIDVFQTQSKTDKAQNSATKTKALPQPQISAISNQNNFNIDFFPEGGSLLENVASVVGFKAVDANGNPINAKGEIYDSDNELITSFQSSHDGMGKFQILPIEGKSYFAKINTPIGTTVKIELPKVLKEGYLLSYKKVKDKNYISIITNENTLLQNPNAALTVVGKAKGVSYFESTQTLTQTTLSFELPKDSAPDGISQITLFDSNNKPQSERLVFVEKDHDLDVQLTTDKISFKPNEKATVNVSSKSKAGTAKSASYSLSVTDMNGIVDEKDFGTTISSYFLMESDIRGKVHNPGYYFDATNVKRYEHLDDLLLTQGWRDFLWKTIPKANDTISYIVEKGFTISGRVKQVLGDKPKVNTGVGLVLKNNKHMNSFKTTTDASGGFKFEEIMFSGKTDLFLNSKNEKGMYGGEIIINPFEQLPAPVYFKNEPIIWSESTSKIVDNVFKKYAAFGVKPENILDEVEIVSKKKKYAPVSYGMPDYKYIIDKKEAKKLNNTAELIEEQCVGVIPANFSMEINSYFDRESGRGLILIDGNEANEAGELLGISPEDVLKIEVASGYVVNALYGKSQVISIFTNGNRNKTIPESFHSIKQPVEGFYTARVFYVPNPEQLELLQDNKTAVRNTIYWTPNIYPDKTGNATISFFNTKVETKVKVALEGITATGIPVVKNTYYTIKK
jgi:hypothetical protein